MKWNVSRANICSLHRSRIGEENWLTVSWREMCKCKTLKFLFESRGELPFHWASTLVYIRWLSSVENKIPIFVLATPLYQDN
uniref:Uncharacterized protein n=1 Tax=Trichogramma kaykai TaxID=54128 RepID=A0ABD2WBJ5_9HYME